MNLILKETNIIQSSIREYHREVEDKAKNRISKAKNLTIVQHMVPDFILKQIAAQNPANVLIEKNLLLKEYRIEFDPITKQLSDFIPVKQPVSPKIYSTRRNIYNSTLLPHEWLLEYMFSLIEGEAARFIRARISEPYDLETKKQINPYYFYLPQLPQKPTKVRARIALATFFASQFLRSEHRKGSLQVLAGKIGLNQNLDFPTQIKEMLYTVTSEIYFRQWTWIRVPNHEMFISELGLVTGSTCKISPSGKTSACMMMPLSRRDFIYLHETVNTHFGLEDKIVCSMSSLFYDWYYSLKLEQIAKLETTILGNGNSTVGFVTNQQAKFSREEFYTPKGCCFSCMLDHIRLDYRNEIFISRDYILS